MQAIRRRFTPLTLHYVDVWDAMVILGEVLDALDRTELVARSAVT
jgi:kynureninase